MQTVFKNQLSEQEFEKFKNFTLELLRDENTKNLCVTFTKKDGTVRELYCTLAPKYIPEEKQPKTESSSAAESAVRVFDTEKSEWRSFCWDSVSKVTFDI